MIFIIPFSHIFTTRIRDVLRIKRRKRFRFHSKLHSLHSGNHQNAPHLLLLVTFRPRKCSIFLRRTKSLRSFSDVVYFSCHIIYIYLFRIYAVMCEYSVSVFTQRTRNVVVVVPPHSLLGRRFEYSTLWVFHFTRVYCLVQIRSLFAPRVPKGGCG